MRIKRANGVDNLYDKCNTLSGKSLRVIFVSG